MIGTLLLSALVGQPALAEPLGPPGGKVVVTIDGMVCGGCQKSVTEALDDLASLDATVASFAVGGACATIAAAGDTDAIRTAIEEVGAYTVSQISFVDACPTKLRKGSRPDPWDEIAEGLDARVISRGEEVDIAEHIAEGKYTLVDFGAPWCGPCHTAAAKLKEYLESNDDAAVRAITLDARDARASFELPAARQHLKFVAGIPYFVVYAPTGKTIYKGDNVVDAIAAIDKKRGGE